MLDAAGTKASVIQVRAEAKDYLDLDALMILGKVDLATALAAVHALYGPTFNPEVTLTALSYFDDGIYGIFRRLKTSPGGIRTEGGS